MGSMYFQGKSCVRFHKLFVVYNSIHASFPMYVCLLSKTLFASYFVPPYDISEVVSLSTPDLLSICLNLFNWAFTFTEKSDCGITVTPKKNLKLSIITLITISVRLFQTIWGYAISLIVRQSAYIIAGIHFYIIVVLCQLHLTLGMVSKFRF